MDALFEKMLENEEPCCFFGSFFYADIKKGYIDELRNKCRKIEGKLLKTAKPKNPYLFDDMQPSGTTTMTQCQTDCGIRIPKKIQLEHDKLLHKKLVEYLQNLSLIKLQSHVRRWLQSSKAKRRFEQAPPIFKN